MSTYRVEIDARVAGIPCVIGVIDYHEVKGSYDYNAASDLDYRGYVECEYQVLDRNGRPADWLERKITEADEQHIQEMIAEYFHSQEDF